MQDFQIWLNGKDYSIPNVALDGKIHRFPRSGSRDSGWMIGWQNHGVKSGKPYIFAIVGDFKRNEEFEFRSQGITREDNRVIKDQQAQAKAIMEYERHQKRIEAAAKSSKIWANAQTFGSTPYMQRKKVSDLYGARITTIDLDPVVIVPTLDIDGKLCGLQRIFADGQKRFMSGQAMKGMHFIFGNLDHAASAFLCEGWSTGASIHQATGEPVICAFNASNLSVVGLEIKKKFNELTITVCGDDDQWGEKNIGREEGDKAALAVRGAAVFPTFSSNNFKPTDFNDLHLFEGLEKVKEQLQEPKEIENGFIPLGFDEGTHLFYNLASKAIVKMTTFAEIQCFNLAPKAYWEAAYISKNGIAWADAKDDLVQMSRAVGPFDSSRIRGTGVWLDRDRTVINTGIVLIVDGKLSHLTALKSHYVYVQTKNKLPAMHKKPLTKEDTRALTEVCGQLAWQDQKSGYLLAGWLAIARIASALPIRPHLWITGGKGTGKSTVMERIVSPALGCEAAKLYLQGGSTEAGIRQSINADSKPVIFDEFETSSQNKERIQQLIELLRQSWSSTQGYIVKGSASGLSVQYSLAFAALVSSIRVNLCNDADRSRFSVLELAPSKAVDWPKIKGLMNQINDDYGERLFARSAAMVKIILKSFHSFSAALATDHGQRFGQQYGMLLAGFYSLMSDDAATKEIAENLIKELDFAEEVKEADLTDERECLSRLMTTVAFRIHYGTAGDKSAEIRNKNLASLLEEKNPTALRQLRNYGIIVERDLLIIANNHRELEKIFDRSSWINWNKSLARLPGADKIGGSKDFGGHKSRAISLPLSTL